MLVNVEFQRALCSKFWEECLMGQNREYVELYGNWSVGDEEWLKWLRML